MFDRPGKSHDCSADGDDAVPPASQAVDDFQSIR